MEKLSTKQQREISIINNTAGKIYIESNPQASTNNGKFLENILSGAQLAKTQYIVFGDKIIAEANKQGVDKDLALAIMYMEVSHGGIYGYPSEMLNKSNSILPMNVRGEWLPLGRKGANLQNIDDNIQIGVTLIKRIQDRLDSPTVEKVATLYNSLAKDKVTDYGARVGDIYKKKLWKSIFKAENEIEQSNPALQWKPTPVTIAKNDERYENIRNMASIALEGKFEELTEELQHKIITTYINDKNQQYAEALSKENNPNYVKNSNNQLSHLDHVIAEAQKITQETQHLEQSQGRKLG